jgi:hypothetical protein
MEQEESFGRGAVGRSLDLHTQDTRMWNVACTHSVEISAANAAAFNRVKREAKGQQDGEGMYFLGESDRCIECGHAWVDEEPAHFADCRYYVLEDGGGEDQEWESAGEERWGIATS